MRQLSPRDAQMYWMSEKIPNDQFLLYAFDRVQAAGVPERRQDGVVGAVRRQLAARAAQVDDLRLRIRDVAGDLDYPYWATSTFGDDQLVVHHPGGVGWDECLAEVGRMTSHALDARAIAWRVHLFPRVHRMPDARDVPGTVAVVQLSHALADGRRAAGIARALWSPATSATGGVPTGASWAAGSMSQAWRAVRGGLRFPCQVALTVGRGVAAWRAHHRELELVGAGALPPPAGGRTPLRWNDPRDGVHTAQVVVRPLESLRGHGVSVTVAALTSISLALERERSAAGEPVPADLGAEVTVAHTPKPHVRNNFRNVSVDLHAQEPDVRRRLQAIARSLRERCERVAHPVFEAQERAGDVVPALVVRAGVRAFRTDSAPASVSGHTVVTSVDRGPADLILAGAAARFTAGFPALSPAMGLTHGVYSLGSVLTVSVHADAVALPDPGRYRALLEAAIDEVAAALR